jgi:hypothetical protein
MEYVVEMGSNVVIRVYIPTCMIGSGIQKLMEGIHRHTDTGTGLRSLGKQDKKIIRLHC